MVTQKQTFERLQTSWAPRDIHGRKTGRRPNSNAISKALRELYLPTSSASQHFYAQNLDGLPTAIVSSKIDGKTSHCNVAYVNELRLRDWRSVPRPSAFAGPRWPPRTVGDLLGCSSVNEDCIECAFRASRKEQGDVYTDWNLSMYNFWLDNILLRYRPPVKGYGLFARNDIPANTCIGEYMGRLVPGEDVADDKTQYQFEIDIGHIVGAGEEQPMCWLDATHTGSIFRFMNHHCDPNAAINAGRCGMHNRILYVYTLRDIAQREQITINYGPDWFAKEEEPCMCGSSKCVNPPKKDQGNAAGKQAPASKTSAPNESEGTKNNGETKEGEKGSEETKTKKPAPPHTTRRSSPRIAEMKSSKKRRTDVDTDDEKASSPPKKRKLMSRGALKARAQGKSRATGVVLKAPDDVEIAAPTRAARRVGR